MQKLRALLLALTGILLCAGAAAEEPRRAGILSEVRLGFLQHDTELLARNREPGHDINAELLFDAPGFLRFAFSPRPHLGVSVATEAGTSQLYAGLTWTFRPFGEGPLDRLWLAGFGGGAVHTGELDSRDPDKKSLGSRVLFRFGAEVGVDVTQRLSVAAYFAHISNAFIVDPNEGLDTAGVRLGWRF